MNNIDGLKTRRRIVDALPKTATAAQLAQIAKILGVRVAYVSNRPHFGANQVRDIYQLRVGMTYLQVHTGGNKVNRKIITVMKAPFFDRETDPEPEGGWWVVVREEHEHGCSFATISLADCSITPYGTGDWSEDSYLAFTEQS